MRLAFFSPFNPLRTGIADYSEELLPALAEHAEIDLITDGYRLENAAIRDRFRILTPAEFLSQSGRYDMPLYQLGNNVEQHGYMVACMQRVPGIAVLHDYYLHYLMLGLTLMRGNMPALKRTLAAKYGDSAASLSRRVLIGMYEPYEVSTTAPLVKMSRAVIMHNHVGANLASADAASRPVRVVPMGIPVRPMLDSLAMKRKYGFADNDFVLTSVSTLSHTKRTPAILRAVARLKKQHSNLRFLILGGGRLGDQAVQMIETLGISSIVRRTGWIEHETYWEYLNLADAAIDLRYPSGAETSASLLRAMSAGRPLIASKQGSFLELPDDCCQKIPVDETEEQRLCEAVTRLIDNPTLTRQMGAASRRHVETTHRPEFAAKRYVEFIQEVQRTPWNEPAKDWFEDSQSAPVRAGYAGIFKACRLAALVRNYGVRATLTRLRSAARPAASVGNAEVRA